LSFAEHKALEELRNNTDIVITQADKGDTFVIMQKDDYITECHRQLNDTDTYKNLAHSQSTLNAKLFRNTLLAMLKNKCITRRQFERLVPHNDQVKDRIFYTLPKIHKPPSTWTEERIPPGRPIVGNTHSEDTAVSKFIDSFLQPIVSQQPYILKNSEELLAALNNVTVKENSILFSLDVKSLFTNIPLAKGIGVVQDFLRKFPDPSRKRPDKYFIELLKISLFKNDFSFNGKYYRQVNGVAMGKQFSGSFANLYMSHWEQQIFEKFPNQKLTKYFRFIDDIFGV
jgi:hypothetical protein